ncbi:MAG: DNA (cytosine-5-)-methyltransferase [Bacillota bacterium]
MISAKKVKVVELFAGVGGFRVGLESASEKFDTIWANQWEPNKKIQHAFDCYVSHFGESENHVNQDIATVKHLVPDHDLLVGGFPCQDYSVAQSGAKGIEGKKGVLWWEIRDIVEQCSPSYVLLENVDRLIKSPAKQRGRDFAIILRCLADLGYAVEWRVINAAEYGFAQRRRRVFIFAYKNTTKLYKKLIDGNAYNDVKFLKNWVLQDGFYAPAFPIAGYDAKKVVEGYLDEYNSLEQLSDSFNGAFYNSGVMYNQRILTVETTPVSVPAIPLKVTMQQSGVDEKYFLNGALDKWIYLKGAKRISRIRPNGEPYSFSEGAMSFPDNIELPARTMLTSESSVNRSSHVVTDIETGKLRLLTPIECERLNNFPDNWTQCIPEKMRYFTMGNALVCGVIEKIGKELLKHI